MKTLWYGVKAVLSDRPWGLWLWAGYVVAFLWLLAEKFPKELNHLMALLCVGGFCLWAYRYGKDRPAEGAVSTAILTETAAVSLSVTAMKADTLPRYQYHANALYCSSTGAPRDPGYLEELFASVENHTGAAIITDTSFQLERRRGAQWYCVPPEEPSAPSWEPLEIPQGHSEIRFLVFGNYPYLPHGDYRIVKSVQTAQGEATVAGGFHIG